MTPLARSTADLTRDYAFVRSCVAANGRTTLLHIGEHDTVVLSGDDAAPDTTFTLSLGSSRTANAFFHHDPPKPAELESAIDTVEEPSDPFSRHSLDIDHACHSGPIAPCLKVRLTTARQPLLKSTR